MEGVATPDKRSDQVVLEANRHYWDRQRFPRLKRVIFDNSLDYNDAIELVKTTEGRVDLVTELRPLETLRVAQSAFAQVVKSRGALESVFGRFNMRKAGSPWLDVRLRQAVNYAMNREHLIRYAAKGNGMLIPALIPRHSFGFDPTLPPYPFDPGKARALLRQAGYPEGRAVVLIAPKTLEVQATVVSKMLEHVGFAVEMQILNVLTYNQKTVLSNLDQPPERQSWDIALTAQFDPNNFPVFPFYRRFALDDSGDWVIEQPELRQLYEEVLRTVDQERQQALIRLMERHTHDQAYFLFLYNPIKLYAVNKAVQFVPYVNGVLNLAETSVTEQHWSLRQLSVQVQTHPSTSQADSDETGQVALGQQVYASFCAGCHGVNLEGQPNWQKRWPIGNLPAPPHDQTGHTWHHPDQWLFEIVKYGGRYHAPAGYRSAMPAYQEMLSDAEIWAVLGFIKSRWPASIRAQQEQLTADHRAEKP